MIKILVIFVAGLIYLTDAGSLRDYYWKDFDGEIPSDAFNVGENQYIGQGLTKDGRILIGAINNSSDIMMAYDTKTDLPLQITTSLKVLCIQDTNYFIWGSFNGGAGSLERVYAGVNQFVDGFHFGTLAIARSYNDGHVGFVDIFSVDNNMYYVHDGVAKKDEEYENLYYITE